MCVQIVAKRINGIYEKKTNDAQLNRVMLYYNIGTQKLPLLFHLNVLFFLLNMFVQAREDYIFCQKRVYLDVEIKVNKGCT